MEAGGRASPVLHRFFIWEGDCAGAGPLLPRYGYACRKSVQGGYNGRPARFCDHLSGLTR